MNHKYYKYLERKNTTKKQEQENELNKYENNFSSQKEIKTKNGKDQSDLKKLLKKPSVIIYLIECIVIVLIVAFLIYKIFF